MCTLRSASCLNYKFSVSRSIQQHYYAYQEPTKVKYYTVVQKLYNKIIYYSGNIALVKSVFT